MSKNTSTRDYGFWVVVFSLFILVAIGITTPFWGVDKQGANQILRNQGYSDIEIDGYGWSSCSSSDWFSTKFTAISPNENKVEGVVCKGLFKGSTIRFFE
jgi:hypothetical protein